MLRAGFRLFGFFEFAWLGVPLALAGRAYMDWARRFLRVGVGLSGVALLMGVLIISSR